MNGSPMSKPQVMEPRTYPGTNMETQMGCRPPDHSASNGIEQGIFSTIADGMNHMLKDAIDRSENNLGQMIFHNRQGSKFAERFAVGQKEFHEQITQLQADNPDRLAVKMDTARCAAAYLNNLSILTQEVVRHLF